ncbi:MAG: nucleotidyltransferase family protein [Sulfitobacter sp.]
MERKIITDMPVIILAAGASRRMRGADKLMQRVDDMPLIRRQALMARAVTIGPVIIALPAPPHPRYDVIADLDITPLTVRDADEGINASLRAAFAAVSKCARAAMVMLADLPALTTQDLRDVIAQVDPASSTLIWRGATETGAPGHPIVFAAPLFAEFAKLTGDTGGGAIIAKAKDHLELIKLPNTHARLDLDTPEDWAAWRKKFPQK